MRVLRKLTSNVPLRPSFHTSVAPPCISTPSSLKIGPAPLISPFVQLIAASWSAKESSLHAVLPQEVCTAIIETWGRDGEIVCSAQTHVRRHHSGCYHPSQQHLVVTNASQCSSTHCTHSPERLKLSGVPAFRPSDSDDKDPCPTHTAHKVSGRRSHQAARACRSLHQLRGFPTKGHQDVANAVPANVAHGTQAVQALLDSHILLREVTCVRMLPLR